MMNAKDRKMLSKTLLIAGAVLMVIGVGYEAINYPWQIVLAKLGVASQSAMADPKPLENATWTTLPAEEWAEGDPLNVLPAQGNLLMARPEVENLTVVGYFKFPKLGISENIVLGSDEELMEWAMSMELRVWARRATVSWPDTEITLSCIHSATWTKPQ